MFAWLIGLLGLARALFSKAGQVEGLVGLLQVDSSKVRRELGVVRSYNLQQCLGKTAGKVRDPKCVLTPIGNAFPKASLDILPSMMVHHQRRYEFCRAPSYVI